MKTGIYGKYSPPLTLALLIAIAGTSLAEDARNDEGILDFYLEAEGYEINNALSGTWYDPSRSGEGLMIDIANHGVAVATYNTYDTEGNQCWLFGYGNVDSSIMEIDFYLTDGGIYGADFDPELVNRYAWGTGTFVFTDCATGVVDIEPFEEFSLEFEAVTLNITRLTVPVNCSPRD